MAEAWHSRLYAARHSAGRGVFLREEEDAVVGQATPTESRVGQRGLSGPNPHSGTWEA